MKKILIYYNENQIKPVGGPSGYLYNLRYGLSQINKEIDIEYLDNVNENRIAKLYHALPEFLLHAIQRERTYRKYRALTKESYSNQNEMSLNEFDAIHFHSTQSLYRCLKQLENYDGSVILTSHTPKAPHWEILEEELEYKHNELENNLRKIDEEVFYRADYIVFPCPEAEEPYYHTWSGYKSIKSENAHKYRYLLTGCKPIESNIDYYEARKKFDIPKDKFVISFVGRHNKVKGYDLLKDIAREVLSVHTDILFLVAGSESPLKGLKNENWIEVGWQNDISPVIVASDLFILPNRETYFDLVLLEVLSMGKPVLLSETGGNKYYKRFQTNRGIRMFHDLKSAIEEILSYKAQSGGALKLAGKDNRYLYDKYFRESIFAQNYIRLIGDILAEKQ